MLFSMHFAQYVHQVILIVAIKFFHSMGPSKYLGDWSILLVYITLVNECDMGKSSISSQGNCGFETITPETAGRGCYGFKTTVTE